MSIPPLKPSAASAAVPTPTDGPADARGSNPRNHQLADLKWRLRWAADGEFAVPVSPAEAQLLIEGLGAR